MGFDRPKKIMPNAQGGRLAAPAYTTFMLETYRRKPVPPDWPRPESVMAMEITCGADVPYYEYFLPGTETDATCGGMTTNPFAIPTRVPSTVPPPAATRPASGTSAHPARGTARDSANPFKIPPA